MRENLDGFELSELPSAEDDEFEFKSSRIAKDQLKDVLSFAASGFSNAGGGILVIGVNGAGNADGGYASTIGHQSIRDWIDQVLHQVEPPPRYDIKLIDDAAGRGSIEPGKNVVAVLFKQSLVGPHMASDRHYYVRLGAHTLKARHFIVESLWARRHFDKPRLIHLMDMRQYTLDSSYMVIDIIALTDAPALDVEIDFAPRPMQDRPTGLVFPIIRPLIDSAHNFAIRFEVPDRFWTEMTVTYRDLAGAIYSYNSQLQTWMCLPKWHHAPRPMDAVVEVLQDIKRTLDRHS